MHQLTKALRASIALLLTLAACSKSPPSTQVDASVDTGTDTRAADVATDLATDFEIADFAVEDVADQQPPSTAISFDEAAFIATHNSYSGGARGTILEQLEGGARFIEFDIHADAVATSGYEVGHDNAGHEVETGGGNPDNLAFTNWLAIVQGWRAQNPQHLPLTIGVDVKNALVMRDYAAGNMAYLNDLIDETFGADLFTEADAAAGWPLVDAMRGRVLVVLSGDTQTRLAYRQTAGAQPAVAVNTSGQVVVAHTSGTQSMLWTGSQAMQRYEPTPGTDPAAALADDGTLVWLSVVTDALQVRTGLLGADHAVVWDSDVTAFVDVAPATNPSVRFVDPTTVREIHETPTGELRVWDGAWDPGTRTIAWTQATSTGPRFDEWSDGGFTVTADATPPYAGSVVHVDDGTSPRRVRLPQRLWSESQFAGPVEFEDDAVKFFAADAFSVQGLMWAEEKRSSGGIVRLWKYNLPTLEPQPPITYAATDQPTSAWYVDYCRTVSCLVE